MGHALAAEPGTEPRPPITEAVQVDTALTDWFRDHLATPSNDTAAPPQPQTAGEAAADTAGETPEDARHGAWSTAPRTLPAPEP